MTNKAIIALLCAPLLHAQSGPTKHSMAIAWVNPSTLSYNCIYRRLNTDANYPSRALSCSSKPIQAWRDYNVTAGVTYCYVVTAIGTFPDGTTVESDFSNEDCKTASTATQDPPTMTTVNPLGTTRK